MKEDYYTLEEIGKKIHPAQHNLLESWVKLNDIDASRLCFVDELKWGFQIFGSPKKQSNNDEWWGIDFVRKGEWVFDEVEKLHGKNAEVWKWMPAKDDGLTS